MKELDFKSIRLVKGTRWYVEFYYRVPAILSHQFKGAPFHRFRIFEDVNRKSGAEQEEYAALLLKSVQFNLAEGYNPFEQHAALQVYDQSRQDFQAKQKRKGVSTDMTITDLLNWYIDKAETLHEVEKKTIRKYKCAAEVLRDHCAGIGATDMLASELDNEFVADAFKEAKRQKEWSSRYYNNQIGFMSIAFNAMKSKKMIQANPCEDMKKMKFVSKTHRYYDDETLKMVLDWMKANNPQLHLAAQFVYYAGVRSGTELINLQVGDIMLDRERIRFRGEVTKSRRDDYVVLDKVLIDEINKSGIMNYPPEYYIFTHHKVPAATKSADDTLQEPFRKLRKALNISQDYTMYSFKHTRAVHLLIDGAKPVDVMQLFRHTDLGTTSKYVRDLGFDLDAKFTEISRTI